MVGSSRPSQCPQKIKTFCGDTTTCNSAVHVLLGVQMYLRLPINAHALPLIWLSTSKANIAQHGAALANQFTKKAKLLTKGPPQNQHQHPSIQQISTKPPSTASTDTASNHTNINSMAPHGPAWPAPAAPHRQHGPAAPHVERCLSGLDGQTEVRPILCTSEGFDHVKASGSTNRDDQGLMVNH